MSAKNFHKLSASIKWINNCISAKLQRTSFQLWVKPSSIIRRTNSPMVLCDLFPRRVHNSSEICILSAWAVDCELLLPYQYIPQVVRCTARKHAHKRLSHNELTLVSFAVRIYPDASRNVTAYGSWGDRRVGRWGKKVGEVKERENSRFGTHGWSLWRCDVHSIKVGAEGTTGCAKLAWMVRIGIR